VLLSRARAGFEPGQRVLLSIRPECVRLSEHGSEPAQFRVQALSSAYLGELCEHELAHGDVTLRAYELNPSSPNARAPGSELWASVSPEDVVLLDRDKSA
jgi:ABC-type Fe3+/spermidine/putrescine transport system ATPase subunit